MPIYDFRCTKCKAEFSLTADSDDEIRDTICVECKAEFEDLKLDAYDRDSDGEALLQKLFERIDQLEKDIRRIDASVTRICSGGIGVKAKRSLVS
jgi:putative FmdB family regulatory protein